MKTIKFIELFENASGELDIKRFSDDIHHSILEMANINMHLIIAMEEMSELQQQLSKYVRGKANTYDIIQEIGDTTLAIEYIKQICNISDEDINKAINIKLDRLEDGYNVIGNK